MHFNLTHGFYHQLTLPHIRERNSHMPTRSKKIHKIMVMEVDRLRLYIDTLGDKMAAVLLFKIEERVKKVLQEIQHNMFFLGEDRFLLEFDDSLDSIETMEAANQIIREFYLPIQLPICDVFLSVNIGISINDIIAINNNQFRNACLALHQSKDLGKNNYMIYSPEIKKNFFKRLTDEHYLKKGYDQEEFELYYQPHIDVRTGRIVGAEALIRWRHPQRGIVPPSEFIPLAEETDFIFILSHWVLETACKQNRIWRDRGYANIRMGINLSLNQFREENLEKKIIEILSSTNLEPDDLDIEITETVAMYDEERAIKTMRMIHQTGVKISLDDFGTGISSFSNLRKFPIQTLKIDKSFIQEMSNNINDAIIVKTIITMGKNLNLKVIAEGVETFKQVQMLSEFQCDEMQGFFFSPPIPAEKFEELLKKSSLY